MLNVIITGASGLVATALTQLLLKETDSFIYLISTHPEDINLRKRVRDYRNRISLQSIESFENYICNNKQTSFFICYHTAFSRSTNSSKISASLLYQQYVLKVMIKANVKYFVNISSQSVYNKDILPPWTESTAIAPDNLYSIGKYCAEIISDRTLVQTEVTWSNIRLCSIIENSRFPYVFVKQAIENHPIVITNPDMECSFMDCRDVARALLNMLTLSDIGRWQRIYNLSTNSSYTIRQIAELVKIIGEERYGLHEIKIILNYEVEPTRCGMDASLFRSRFLWTPKYTINDMIIAIFNQLIR